MAVIRKRKGKKRVTIYIPADLWRVIRLAAVDIRGASASSITAEALEDWLKKHKKLGKAHLRRQRAPEVTQWFAAYNEMRARWGELLNLGLPPLKMSNVHADLIGERIEAYGLTELLKILYKVEWSDYHMGRGAYSHQFPRLSVPAILKVDEKIDSIVALQTLEDPEVARLRNDLGEVEKKIRALDTSNLATSLKAQEYERLSDKAHAINARLFELTGR